jgi:hypothetical protein
MVRVSRVDNRAFAPFTRRRQVEHGARTAHEGFRGDREDVPAGFPVRHPAEALQRSV